VARLRRRLRSPCLTFGSSLRGGGGWRASCPALKTVGGDEAGTHGLDCGLHGGGHGARDELQRQVSDPALLALAVGVVGSRLFSVLSLQSVDGELLVDPAEEGWVSPLHRVKAQPDPCRC
jgi:hypothetical protein